MAETQGPESGGTRKRSYPAMETDDGEDIVEGASSAGLRGSARCQTWCVVLAVRLLLCLSRQTACALQRRAVSRTPSRRTKRKKAEREGRKERTADETDSDSEGEEGREGDADLSSEQPEDYPYIKKVTLRNFMCHEHLTVDFIPKVLPAGCSRPLPCPRTREPALIVSAI